jgi:hypothetical protein
MEFHSVKNVPVNYAFRFSGPVTALTARRVRYGVGPDLICQPGPSPGIEALVPRRFSINSLPPFFPLDSLPSCSCLRPLLSSTCSLPAPRSPQNRYDAASGKNVAVPRLALIRSTLGCVVSSTFRPVHRPLTTTPMKRPASQQVAADLITRSP